MRKLIAEALGTAILLATVVGSGIMGAQLSPENDAIALLSNAIATGAILYVLITIFGPLCGAHFNPAVTLVFLWRREISSQVAFAYIPAQIVGAILGVLLANAMFDLDVLQLSTKTRASVGQSLSELVATFGLILVILGGVTYRPKQVAMLVGLYITAAYWFTASTSFANPAVTVARMFSDTFAGISPASVPMFLCFQIVGAALAALTARALFKHPTE
ncbi:MAG: MIP/aquaporin family protein [Pseudomonadota bacterium]